jgi:hypothetical protein
MVVQSTVRHSSALIEAQPLRPITANAARILKLLLFIEKPPG